MTKSNIIFLSNVRLSFPHLIDPQRQLNTQTGAERISYNCEFIMPHDHPGYQEFMAQFGILAADKWKEHAQNVIAMIQQDRKTRCFGAGHEKINKKTFQPYDGYSGMVYLTAGRETPPQMIQASGAPIDPTDTLAYQTLARGLYGGCRVNAAVKPWLQDNKHGRAIRCDLVAIQFLADDTPFGEVEADITGMFPGVQPQMPTAPFPGVQQQMPTAPFPGVQQQMPTAPFPGVQQQMPTAPFPGVQPQMPTAPFPSFMTAR